MAGHDETVGRQRAAQLQYPGAAGRIASIDVFRALTMFLMIFVNDLWSVSGVPHWMGHAAHDEDMLGLSDVVFPAFLFILGMSIPMAIEKRLAKNRRKGPIAWHIVVRSVALLIMGIFSVNSGAGLAETTGISKPVFSLLMIACFFVIWNDYPKAKNSNVKALRIATQIVAVAGLIILAFIYRDPSGGCFRPRWWGILGLVGWTYLICAFIYLLLRRHRAWLAVWGMLFVLMCVAGIEGWLGRFGGIIPGNGCFHAFTMAGLLLSLSMNLPKRKASAWKKMVWAGIAGTVFIGLGWLANGRWIISKLQESPPWLFYCTGISILAYLFIHWLVDIKGHVRLFDIIKPAGTATLTCYLIPSVLYAIFMLTGFTGISFMSEGLAGIMKCVLFALLVVGITALLGKVHVKLKI